MTRTAPRPRSATAGSPAARRSRAPHFPEIEHDRAEQQRNRQDRARGAIADRADGIEASSITHSAAREPDREHHGPKADRRPSRRSPGSRSSASVVDRCADDASKPAIRSTATASIQAATANSSAAASDRLPRARPRRQTRWPARRKRQHQRQQHRDAARTKPEAAPARVHGRVPMRRATHAFDQTDQADQARGEDRGGKQRRPDLHGLAVIGAGQQPRADAGLGAGRQFGDDGADQRDRDRDLQAGEKIGDGRRPAQFPEAPDAASPTRSASVRAASDPAR